MRNARVLNYLLAVALLFVIVKINLSSPMDRSPHQESTMNNHTLETIHQRKSVRNFVDTPVAESDLIELIRAGMAAPTAVNKQPWSFITVQDRATLNSLGDQLPYAKMLHSAQAAIVVCGDLTKALTSTAQDYWVQDCSAATQNILLAAESMGLGAVWTATYPYEDRVNPVRKALNLPEHLIPLNIIPIGYPDGSDQPKDKWQPDNVHIESYGHPLVGHAVSRTRSPERDPSATHQAWVLLTVSESKRLIARGLLNYPPVQRALKSGKLLITKGTTNTYIAEEVLHEPFTTGEFVYGHILPAATTESLDLTQIRAELSLDKGVPQELPYAEFIQQMATGDIVLKGANLINYQKGQAAVLTSHPAGGTWGIITPAVQNQKLRLIIPVGLEKDCSHDLYRQSNTVRSDLDPIGPAPPKLKLLQGELFTEIEAIQQLAKVEANQIGSGGIGGAEGAITLLIRGDQVDVEQALEIIRNIQGEPPYLKR